jgi:hypothetical protein
VEQEVPTDAGEEIQESRTIPEKAEAGEILRTWDSKVAGMEIGDYTGPEHV